MSRYTFRVRNKGGERGLGVSAFYGEVGWDEELATFYARVWREAAKEPLTPADYEPLVSCGGQLFGVTDGGKKEGWPAARGGGGPHPARGAFHLGGRVGGGPGGRHEAASGGAGKEPP